MRKLQQLMWNVSFIFLKCPCQRCYFWSSHQELSTWFARLQTRWSKLLSTDTLHLNLWKSQWLAAEVLPCHCQCMQTCPCDCSQMVWHFQVGSNLAPMVHQSSPHFVIETCPGIFPFDWQLVLCKADWSACYPSF